MPPVTALAQPNPRPPRKRPLRPQHRKLRNRPGPQHLPRVPKSCRPRKLPDLLPWHPQPLLDPLPPRPQRVPQANASTALLSSAAWPRNTVSTSPPSPVPAQVDASASKTSKPTWLAATSRPPKLPSLEPPNLRSQHQLPSAPPPHLHRPPLPAARPTSPSSPPSRARKCTSAITKCSP